jgi:restriction system protein
MGFFGGHLFYVGRGQKAVIYIFTFGLMGIGMFIDLLLILSNSFEDAYEMKLTRW